MFAAVLLLPLAAGLALGPRAEKCEADVNITGNPFATRTLYPINFYKSKVLAAVASIADPALQAKASRVANVGTFLWLNKIFQLHTLEEEIQNVPCSSVLGIVVNNLPTRKCQATIGEGLPKYDISNYKADYIDRQYSVVSEMSRADRTKQPWFQ